MRVAVLAFRVEAIRKGEIALVVAPRLAEPDIGIFDLFLEEGQQVNFASCACIISLICASIAIDVAGVTIQNISLRELVKPSCHITEVLAFSVLVQIKLRVAFNAGAHRTHLTTGFTAFFAAEYIVFRNVKIPACEIARNVAHSIFVKMVVQVALSANIGRTSLAICV